MAKKPKKRKHSRGIMGRSDIPYAQRIRMQQSSDIRVGREQAARVALYCLSVAMNELEHVGYKGLVRYSYRYKDYENEFYQDPEVGMAHAKRRMEQMGMPISGEWYFEKVDGLTVRQQEVHDNSLQAIQVALTIGAISAQDEFGYAQIRQQRIAQRVLELSARYAKEGIGFPLEKMEKIGFVIVDGVAVAFLDDDGNGITYRQWKRELQAAEGAP